MKSFWVVFCVSVCCNLAAHAVLVTGNVYLSGQPSHENTRVIFEAVSPSAETDSALTEVGGYFSAGLQPGVYNIIYSHDQFATYRLPNQVLLWDTALDPVTLMPPLSGYLSGFLGPGDFQVVDSIVVTSGQTLVVQPGTRLFFDGMHQFVIRGLLTAIGTEQDSIVLTRRYASGSDTLWDGMRFRNASNSCRMEYCLIEHGAGEGYVFYDGGGGIFCQNCDLNLSYCTLQNNEPLGSYYGGAVFFLDSSPSVFGCVFVRNRIGQWGGGIFCRNAVAAITGCRFERNMANEGGGILLYDTSHANIDSCWFIDNSANSSGADIMVSDGSDALIIGCVFEHSSATAGNAVSVGSNSELSRSSFFGQSDDYYGMINVYGSGVVSTCAIFVTTGNGIYFGGAAESQVRYCNVFAPNSTSLRFYGNDPAQGPPAIGLIALTNANNDSCDTYYNIFLDPQFADTANGDYHLLASSPCIDAGDPELEPDPDGTVADMGVFYFNQLGVPDEERTAVRHYELMQNYPNPFNSATRIEFNLPRAGNAELTVYDVTGRRIKTLAAGPMAAGHHEVLFDAGKLPSGIYFYQLRANAIEQTRKMVLIR